jgi:hypothetical protein
MQSLYPGGPGVHLVNVSGDNLRANIALLESHIQALKDELVVRKGDGNTWRYGFLGPDHVWLGFDSYDAALAGAKETWPDDPEAAAYRVTRIYI